jgi:hypothetical protein
MVERSVRMKDCTLSSQHVTSVSSLIVFFRDQLESGNVFVHCFMDTEAEMHIKRTTDNVGTICNVSK